MAEGFDVGLEMSGAPAAFDQLFDSVVTGGRIALLGLPSKPTLVDWNKVIFKQLTIKGIYGREMFETWHKMIAMLQSGLDVRKVITHRLPARGLPVRLRDDAARRVRQDRARLVERRPLRLRSGGLVAAVRIRSLTIGDAAAAASLIREAFAAQSHATDPPSGALGETTASVAAKLAEGGGAGAEADGALVGVALWAEKDGALHIGRISTSAGLAQAGNCARPAGGGRSGSAPARP